MEDVGKYGCTAGNSGGFEREEVYLHVSSKSQPTPFLMWYNYDKFTSLLIACCSVNSPVTVALKEDLCIYIQYNTISFNGTKNTPADTSATQDYTKWKLK